MPEDGLKVGDRVDISVDPTATARDWDPAALTQRLARGSGVVTGVHDSHGLCYAVRHDPGIGSTGLGYYEPHELTPSGGPEPLIAYATGDR